MVARIVADGISIHALREEGDAITQQEYQYIKFLSTPSARRATSRTLFPVRPFQISIHALREEGDPLVKSARWRQTAFLSTPSARRATDAFTFFTPGSFISIHALREEGDY